MKFRNFCCRIWTISCRQQKISYLAAKKAVFCYLSDFLISKCRVGQRFHLVHWKFFSCQFICKLSIPDNIYLLVLWYNGWMDFMNNCFLGLTYWAIGWSLSNGQGESSTPYYGNFLSRFSLFNIYKNILNKICLYLLSLA